MAGGGREKAEEIFRDCVMNGRRDPRSTLAADFAEESYWRPTLVVVTGR